MEGWLAAAGLSWSPPSPPLRRAKTCSRLFKLLGPGFWFLPHHPSHPIRPPGSRKSKTFSRHPHFRWWAANYTKLNTEKQCKKRMAGWGGGGVDQPVSASGSGSGSGLTTSAASATSLQAASTASALPSRRRRCCCDPRWGWRDLVLGELGSGRWQGPR